jgi:hypothetical protein
MMAGNGRNMEQRGVNENKFAFETAVHVCISDKLVQRDAEIQYLLNLLCTSWRLSPSQRRTSKIPPLSWSVCMCNTPIVARQRLGKMCPSFHC